jgi:hypothetical protein
MSSPDPAVEDVSIAVEHLVYDYAKRLDAGDLDGVARLFARATWRAGPRVLTGTAEVRSAYDPVRIYPDGRPGTQHVITNLIVVPDGGRAASRCYFTVLQAGSAILAGRYHDTFAWDGGAWHFTDRHILADLRGDLSRHYR